MAVVGSVVCGGNVCLKRHESSNLFNFHNPNARPCSFMVSDPQSSRSRTSTKILASSPSKVSLQPLPKQEEKKRNKLLYEKIDEWMRDSVVEIVKKLPESPLLVHVYSDNNTIKTRTEKAMEDNWVALDRLVASQLNGQTETSRQLACFNDNSINPATIYVPPGRFLLRSVVFHSQCKNNAIIFRIDGTLVAPSDYKVIGSTGNWILFEHVNEISVYGGILDGQGAGLWTCYYFQAKERSQKGNRQQRQKP